MVEVSLSWVIVIVLSILLAKSVIQNLWRLNKCGCQLKFLSFNFCCETISGMWNVRYPYLNLWYKEHLYTENPQHIVPLCKTHHLRDGLLKKKRGLYIENSQHNVPWYKADHTAGIAAGYVLHFHDSMWERRRPRIPAGNDNNRYANERTFRFRPISPPTGDL